MQLELELDQVQKRLDALNNEKFGKKSERRGRPDKNKGEKPPRKKPSRTGPTPQDNLEKSEQLHLLDEPDQICPNCADPLLPIEGKTEDDEVIDIVERTYRVKIHKKQVYRCRCCKETDTALGPPALFPHNGRYSPAFAVSVAVDKYRDNIPLTKQVLRMANVGLNVTSQTLWDQLCRMYTLLLPTLMVLHQRILQSALVHVDETTWRLMKPGASKKWWVWVISDGLRVFFLLAPTRGQAAARELLRNYAGIVMADRYAVYEALEKARSNAGGAQMVIGSDGESVELYTPDYTLAACWSHCRRGFVKAEKNDNRAAHPLDLIAELYAIEAQAKKAVAHIEDDDERNVRLLEERRRLRSERSAPVIARLKSWADKAVVIPKTPLAKAIAWMNNGWTQLSRFLADPRIPLDNNLAERLVRAFVLGRKVYYGSRSEHGTRVAALFYSLMGSCRLLGIDAQAYLNEAVLRAIANPGSAFLPEDFAALMEEREREERLGHDEVAGK